MTQSVLNVSTIQARKAKRWSSTLLKLLAGFHRWILVLSFVVLWQAGTSIGWINVNSFSSPLRIIQVIYDGLRSGDLILNIWSSLSKVIVGVGIASIFGILLGSVCARFAHIAVYLSAPIELIRPISVIAWIPVAIIWFGLGDGAAWFIIGLGAFFPVYSNVFFSMKQIPAVYIRAAQTLGLSRINMLIDILMPASLPGILSGIRIGLGVGWMCVIAAEMISATSGLGYMIQTARIMLDTEQVFAGMVVIGLVGFLMNYIMLHVENRITHWNKISN